MFLQKNCLKETKWKFFHKKTDFIWKLSWKIFFHKKRISYGSYFCRKTGTYHVGILFAAVRAENANMPRHQHVSTEKKLFFKRRKFPNKKKMNFIWNKTKILFTLVYKSRNLGGGMDHFRLGLKYSWIIYDCENISGLYAYNSLCPPGRKREKKKTGDEVLLVYTV